MALSNKRRVFIEEYLQCWNATEAARRAGYKHAMQMGSRLIKVDIIQDLIQERIAEIVMSADEAMMLLTKLAEAELGDYIDDTGVIDFIKVKENSYPISDITHDKGKRSRISIEGRQRALETILKVHGKFVHRVSVEGLEGLEIELPARATANNEA